MVVFVGFAVVCLAGIGVGIPAVMASVSSVPGPAIPPGWPADKVAGLQAENQMRQAAVNRPVVAPAAPLPAERSRYVLAGPASAPVSQSGTLTPGIVPLTAGGPFDSSQFLGTNLWNGPAQAQWEVVQAGGVPTDPPLGAASPTEAGLFVYTQSPDPAASSAQRVLGVLRPAPDPAGMFTVEKVAGDMLTLSLSGSRKAYYFDVATLRFVR